MIKLFNINSVTEALICYFRRLNGEKAQKGD